MALFDGSAGRWGVIRDSLLAVAWLDAPARMLIVRS
jgi:hypothetical protein